MRIPLLSLLFLWLLAPEPAPAQNRIAVVVADVAPDKELLTREDLEGIFRRKIRFWKDGTPILPVNLPVTNPLRRAFSRLVLGAPPEALESYWNEQYFHGVSPPYVLASEEAVLRFVATTPGAIGYINAARVDGSVHVLLYLPFLSDDH
jgi:ABC-type phosphate transport system substrate-binding protein